MSAGERAWVENALHASDDVMMRRLRLPPDPRPIIIVFNDRCRFEIENRAGLGRVAPQGQDPAAGRDPGRRRDHLVRVARRHQRPTFFRDGAAVRVADRHDHQVGRPAGPDRRLPSRIFTHAADGCASGPVRGRGGDLQDAGRLQRRQHPGAFQGRSGLRRVDRTGNRSALSCCGRARTPPNHARWRGRRSR